MSGGRKAQFPARRKFGAWTVIGDTLVIKHGHVHVLMQCKCGKVELRDIHETKRSLMLGCRSCSSRERRSRPIKIGDRYKHWTVLDGPSLSPNGQLLWLAECDCKRTRRWMQANELTNPSSVFQCAKCATPGRLRAFLERRGMVGDLRQGKFGKLQRVAAVRKIPFTLTKEYLDSLYKQQNGLCAITGDELPGINESSLDRIDSTKPYQEGNVQWVSTQANLCKHTLSMPELLAFCRKVLDHANQQPSQRIQ